MTDKNDVPAVVLDVDAPYANQVATSASDGGLRLTFIENRNDAQTGRAAAFIEWGLVAGLRDLLDAEVKKREAPAVKKPSRLKARRTLRH